MVRPLIDSTVGDCVKAGGLPPARTEFAVLEMIVVGADPTPPPRITLLDDRVELDAIVVAELKYGTPPEVPLALTVNVPDDVIGDPVTVNTPGIVSPMLVTVPVEKFQT